MIELSLADPRPRSARPLIRPFGPPSPARGEGVLASIYRRFGFRILLDSDVPDRIPSPLAGEGGAQRRMRGRSDLRRLSKRKTGSSEDRVRHSVGCVDDLMIPEACDRKTLTREPRVSDCVARATSVPRAVALDDQASLETDEIDDVASERNLPTPLQRRQPTGAQQVPQAFLGLSGPGPKRSAQSYSPPHPLEPSVIRLRQSAPSCTSKPFTATSWPRILADA